MSDMNSPSSDEITATELLYKDLLDSLDDNTGLNLTQFLIMLAIDEFGENPSVKEIAKLLHMKSSLVSMALKKLEDRRFVCKVQRDYDKRWKTVSLTTLGANSLELANTSVTRHFDAFWNELSTEGVEAVHALLTSVADTFVGYRAADENKNLGADTIVALVAVHNKFVDIAKGVGEVSLNEWRVLKVLDDQGGQARMADIADRLFMQSGSLVFLSKQLEDRDLIIKNSGNQAANATNLELTDKGRKTYSLVQEVMHTIFSSVLYTKDTSNYLAISGQGAVSVVSAFKRIKEAES